MVFILMSDGLPTPHWETYIPTADRIFFNGDEKHLKSLYQYAKSKNISVSMQLPINPTIVLAFWNGTPDTIDEMSCSFPSSCVRLFLPTENGDGFGEYISGFN